MTLSRLLSDYFSQMLWGQVNELTVISLAFEIQLASHCHALENLPQPLPVQVSQPALDWCVDLWLFFYSGFNQLEDKMWKTVEKA